MDWRTPLGETHVIAKIKHPAWYPPESIRKEHAENGDPLPKVVPSGPDNPLGDFALRLAAGNGEYMLHGTNNPTAVGMAVTHGCIRMYPEDVAALFALVPVGTPVRLVDEPVKVAWVEGQLLLEAHPRSTPKARALSRTCSCYRRSWIRRSAATPRPFTGIWRVPRSRPPAAFRRWWVWQPTPKRRHPPLPRRAYRSRATEAGACGARSGLRAARARRARVPDETQQLRGARD